MPIDEHHNHNTMVWTEYVNLKSQIDNRLAMTAKHTWFVSNKTNEFINKLTELSGVTYKTALTHEVARTSVVIETLEANLIYRCVNLIKDIHVLYAGPYPD